MALTITDSEITSDCTPFKARFVPQAKSWVVNGYAGRAFDRNQAITAMTIAEEKARPEPDRALIASLEDEFTQ